MRKDLNKMYRPHNFDSVSGQETVVEALRNQSIRDDYDNVYLFYGQRGTGKTTNARILMMSANCTQKDSRGNPCCQCPSCVSILEGTNGDVQEIDAASNTGVDSAREIIEKAQYPPFVGKYRGFIIDEVHMLSNSAFNALLKQLEEPHPHCIFVLCTTEAEKIPDTIKSRAMGYNFSRISIEDIGNRLRFIAEQEGINITDDAVQMIAAKADGVMRDAVKYLKHVSRDGEEVTADLTAKLLGITVEENITEIVKSVLAGDVELMLRTVKAFEKKGKNFMRLINEMIGVSTDILLFKTGNTVVGTTGYMEGMKELSGFPTENLVKLPTLLNEARGCMAQNGAATPNLIIGLLEAMNGLRKKEEAHEQKEKIPVAVAIPAAPEKPQNEPKTEERNIVQPVAQAAQKTVCEPQEDDDCLLCDFDDLFDDMMTEAQPVRTEAPAPAVAAVSEEPRPAEKPVERQPAGFAPVKDSCPFEENRPERPAVYDDGYNYPECLSHPEKISARYIDAYCRLRELCKSEKAVGVCLRYSRICETEEGLTVITDDFTSQNTVMALVARHGIDNVSITMDGAA